MTSVEKRVLEVKITDYSANTFKYVYFFGGYDASIFDIKMIMREAI